MIKTIAITAVLACMFFISTILLPPDRLREVLSSGLIVACLMGVYRWGGAALEVYRKRAGERSSLGIIGVVLMLAAIAANQGYAILFVRLGRPDWLIAQNYLNAIIFVLLVAAALFVTSTRFDGEKPTPTSGAITALIAVLGIMLTSVGGFIVKFLAGAVQALVHLF